MTTSNQRRTGQDFTSLIDDFVHDVRGVSHALLLSTDGFPLAASTAMSTVESEQLAAISCGLLSLAGNSASLFGKGVCEQIIIRLSHGYFLFMGIDDGSGLAVLTGPECDMKVAAYEMTKFVTGAGHALTPEVRAELRRTLTGRRGPG